MKFMGIYLPSQVLLVPERESRIINSLMSIYQILICCHAMPFV